MKLLVSFPKILLCSLVLSQSLLYADESLPPLMHGKPPKNLDELWGGYDPQKDPLETQMVREWKDGDITYRYVVFTIGTFKGQKSRLAAFYAFPKSDRKLPAILQVHGGGQRASVDAVTEAADNGYAGLSINWGGNDMERMEKGDPSTDWGALDATLKHNDHYAGGKPDSKTLDAIESPRNNNWFLLVLAARRGLTFLEQQPEVDPAHLGVTGHSMGGKITVDVAGIDKRVKAAVPSCGGAGSVSGRLSGMPGSGLRNENTSLTENTIDDNAYIPRITCPILYLAPTDDFAGPFDNMTENWKKIGSREVAYAIAPHLNHRSIPETGICGILWFDQYLKGTFSFPKTPDLIVNLKTPNGVPQVTVKPDSSAEVVKVDIYYSVDPHCLTRFWRDGEAKQHGAVWIADCPVMSTAQPLYVYANVSYPLKAEGVVAARRQKEPDTFINSSREAILYPEDLVKAGVKATDKPSRLIDDFSRGWQDWYRLEWGNPHVWIATTRKLKDPKWRGPAEAKLVFDVKCPNDNVIAVVADLNGWGAFSGKPSGTYTARKPLKGSTDWQTVSIELKEMMPDKTNSPVMSSWDTVTEFSFRRAKSYLQDGQEVEFGTDSQGWRAPREFRNLCWEGGSANSLPELPAMSDTAPKNLDETIQKEIKKSIELESRDKAKP